MNPFRSARLRRIPAAGAVAATIALGLAGTAAPHRDVAAVGSFSMGIPTVVDPVRGVGEPDIAVTSATEPFISGPAGTSAQTSFFWTSRDGGQSFYQRGPHNGHWVCAAAGGGDSLNIVDRANDDMYVVDQEGLAQLGMGKIDNATGALHSTCANAPGFTADRPFFAIVHPTGPVKAPQVVADGGKTITYLSWQCNGCQGLTASGVESGNTSNGGGLAYGWTDDGVTYHVAEPGVVADNPITGTLQLSSAISSYSHHGNMVADPVTGDVYTAISCGGGCPDGSSGNSFGVAVGKPAASPSATNPGQFDSLTYQNAADKEADGSAIPNAGSLFPVVDMDSARTLYEAWIQGPSSVATPTATDWHLYYVYSTCDAADGCSHTHWSKPIQVDHGPQTAISTFGWMSAGDQGKLGFVWLGTSSYEHPSLKDANRVWYPFTAVTTNGDTPTPTVQQARVGSVPSHLNDICLFGTTCAVPDAQQMALGNRNMADFISTDIGPDGALQITYADDANNIATLPSTLLPGLPVTMHAREVSGPRLRGSGTVSDGRFSSTPVTGITDAAGDAQYPVDGGGSNVPQLDLSGSSIDWDGSNLTVHMPVSSLANLTSPDSSDQTTVWWVTSWKFANHIYFAKASSAGGAAPTFTAGTVASYDRPGICFCTSPTLVDYSGGSAVTGKQNGNVFDITVPASAVGGPTTGALLTSVAAYAMLDNGRPLFVGPGSANIPTIVDATPVYNRLLGTTNAPAPAGTAGTAAPGQQVTGSPVVTSSPNTSAVRTSGGAAAAVVALGAVLWLARRRRSRAGL